MKVKGWVVRRKLKEKYNIWGFYYTKATAKSVVKSLADVMKCEAKPCVITINDKAVK